VLNIQWLIVTDGQETKTIYALDFNLYSSLFVWWNPFIILFAAFVGATYLIGLLNRLFPKIVFGYRGLPSHFEIELINLARRSRAQNFIKDLSNRERNRVGAIIANQRRNQEINLAQTELHVCSGDYESACTLFDLHIDGKIVNIRVFQLKIQFQYRVLFYKVLETRACTNK
jgi:hypothetical protein